MRTIGYSQARANFAAVLDSVIDDAEEVVITRSGHEPAVIVSLAEYSSLKETDYLLRNPVNAEKLRRAIADLEAGIGIQHELVDPGE